MEGVATELLYQVTLSSLFAITHNILCQQVTDSNKNGFALILIPLNATYNAKRK